MYLNLLYYIASYLFAMLTISPIFFRSIRSSTYYYLIPFLKGLLITLFYKYLSIDINVLWTIIIFVIIGNYSNLFYKQDKTNGEFLVFGLLFSILPFEVLFSTLIYFLSNKKLHQYKTILSMATLVILSYIFHPNIPEINTHTPIILIFILMLIYNKKEKV